LSGRFFRQWIHPRDGVTENAIGINERIDARLQRAFAQISPRFGGHRFNRRAIFAVEVPELEPLKKCRPTGIERIGIFSAIARNSARASRDSGGWRRKDAWYQHNVVKTRRAAS